MTNGFTSKFMAALAWMISVGAVLAGSAASSALAWGSISLLAIAILLWD
ncbi:Uncharacterised protein [Mycobacteroides abscessus subsp. massiliense]|nr:Uncharacterised protein [Mycobacteroides abscessus subsp. massiliense]